MVYRRLIIFFLDGSKLSFEFPEQVEDKASVGSYVQKLLSKNELVLELEDRMVVIPNSNIKYVEIIPGPPKYPETAIKHARLIT